jgi:hypothetical protein
VVNFTEDAYLLVQTDLVIGVRNHTSVVSVGVGNRTYIGDTSVPVSPSGKMVSSPPHMLELRQRSDALSRLLGPLAHPARVGKVRDLGPSSIDGLATTRYRITRVVHPLCTDDAAENVDIWVDKLGRILRETTTSVVTFPASRSGRAPESRSRRETTVYTLTLSDFGARATISIPTHLTRLPPSGTAGVSARCTS